MISIIVPVYNKEKYVKSCVHSLLKQTFSDIEIILIDDGSTDNSGQICDELALSSNKVHTYHMANSGVSVARNKGIELAKGEYIFFSDADDKVPNNALNDLYFSMEKHSSDLAMGTIAIVYPHFNTYNKLKNGYYDVANKKDILDVLLHLLESACGKLYKRSLVLKNKIQFPVGFKASEDAYFLNDYLSCISSISTVEKITYRYNKLDFSSTTFNYYKDFNVWNLSVLEKTKVAYKKWSINSEQENKCINEKAANILKDCSYVYSIREKNENESLRLLNETYDMFESIIDFNNIKKLDSKLINLYIEKDMANIRLYFLSKDKKGPLKRIINIVTNLANKMFVYNKIKQFKE